MNALPSIIYDPNARVNSCTSDGLLVVIYRQVFEALEAVLLENEVPPPRVLEAEPVGADEVEPPLHCVHRGRRRSYLSRSDAGRSPCLPPLPAPPRLPQQRLDATRGARPRRPVSVSVFVFVFVFASPPQSAEGPAAGTGNGDARTAPRKEDCMKQSTRR